MTTVVYLTGDSMNDALAAAGRAHRILFEGLGHEFLEINFARPDAQALLGRAIAGPGLEFVYAPMGMGGGFRGKSADGTENNLWEGLRVPFISLVGDSPAYFFERHVATSPWHATLYYYPEHLELRKRLEPKGYLYGLVPPMPFDMADRRDVDFGRKAQGKLLFLKNGNDPEKLVAAWRNGMPADTFLLLAEAASQLAGRIADDLDCDIDRFVRDAFESHGWDIGEFRNLRLFFIAQLDDYLRRVKSTLIADAIADFPVHIQGFNWDHLDFSGRRATYVKGGDYTQSRQQIIESLGVIDMSPNTQKAPHDRAMRAYGLWTLCITNRQRYFDENLAGAAEFSYRFDKQSVQAKVADVLAQPKRYVELGQQVAAQFREQRRPEAFAEFMVATANHVRLACGPRPAEFPEFFVWPPPRFV
ncbi:MAG: hypothetical protein IT518_25260 [Burkholderiales bacterium]|nr:hypothetical protein [Burkholderiales bacterium]